MTGELLTVEGVCDLLGVSKRTVHGWTSARTIPCRRIPGTRRIIFIENELRQWIDAGGNLPLEVIEQPHDGLIVRVKEAIAA